MIPIDPEQRALKRQEPLPWKSWNNLRIPDVAQSLSISNIFQHIAQPTIYLFSPLFAWWPVSSVCFFISLHSLREAATGCASEHDQKNQQSKKDGAVVVNFHYFHCKLGMRKPPCPSHPQSLQSFRPCFHWSRLHRAPPMAFWLRRQGHKLQGPQTLLLWAQASRSASKWRARPQPSASLSQNQLPQNWRGAWPSQLDSLWPPPSESGFDFGGFSAARLRWYSSFRYLGPCRPGGFKSSCRKSSLWSLRRSRQWTWQYCTWLKILSGFSVGWIRAACQIAPPSHVAVTVTRCSFVVHVFPLEAAAAWCISTLTRASATPSSLDWSSAANCPTALWGDPATLCNVEKVEGARNPWATWIGWLPANFHTLQSRGPVYSCQVSRLSGAQPNFVALLHSHHLRTIAWHCNTVPGALLIFSVEIMALSKPIQWIIHKHFDAMTWHKSQAFHYCDLELVMRYFQVSPALLSLFKCRPCCCHLAQVS